MVINAKIFININKGPTLSLVKTIQNKIFGGFTPLYWNDYDGYLFDPSNQTFY